MLGFEPRISDVGSDRSAKCATTKALLEKIFLLKLLRMPWHRKYPPQEFHLNKFLNFQLCDWRCEIGKESEQTTFEGEQVLVTLTMEGKTTVIS